MILHHSSHLDSECNVACPTKTLEEVKKNVGGYLSLQKAYRIELAMNVGWYPAYVFVHLNFKPVGISKAQKAQNQSQNYL